MICPTGFLAKCLSSPFCKNIFVSRLPKSLYNSRHPVPHRGAFRDRHGRWVRDAMDALAPLDEGRESGRRSRVVLTPRCWRQVLERQASRGRRWQKSPITGESAKETVKTIAQGRPDESGVPVVTNSCAFYQCTRAVGAAGTRLSLRPLFGGKDMLSKPRTQCAARSAGACPGNVIASDAKQSVFVRRHEVLRFARNDDLCCVKIESVSRRPCLARVRETRWLAMTTQFQRPWMTVVPRKIRSAQLTIFWHCGFGHFSFRTTGSAPGQQTVNGFGRGLGFQRVWQC